MLSLFKKAILVIVSSILIISAIPCVLDATEIKSSDNEAQIYHKIQNDNMKIAITFDDGPHPRQTKEILDILDEYNIKATFFIIGVNADNYPDTLCEVVKRGHEIGNHTYSHPHVSSINYNTLENEVAKCKNSIEGHTGITPKLFRPPEGLIDSDVKSISQNYGYNVILWSIDTRDWAHTSASKIIKNVTENISAGDIILMHDYIGTNSHTAEALRGFIPILLEKGYKFVPISELIDD